MTQDHYATLGVPPTADAVAIRTAFLALMREYHPDRNSDPAAVERAQAVIAAFKVLADFDQRNHYDWDRRRAREAAEAQAAKRPRRMRSVAAGAGAIGLAAVAAWVFTPAPDSRPKAIVPEVAEARRLPPATVTPKREAKRVAARKAEPMPAKEVAKPAKDLPEPARIARAKPVRVPVLNEPKADRAAIVRVAAVKAPPPRAAPPPTSLPVRREAKAVAKPARPSVRPAADLASLDQFVMSFYGQSWRYGDAPKRAALVRLRADFVTRRGACAADGCKREAYLKLMRDVSAIVESGPPTTR